MISRSKGAKNPCSEPSQLIRATVPRRRVRVTGVVARSCGASGTRDCRDVTDVTKQMPSAHYCRPGRWADRLSSSSSNLIPNISSSTRGTNSCHSHRPILMASSPPTDHSTTHTSTIDVNRPSIRPSPSSTSPVPTRQMWTRIWKSAMGRWACKAMT